MRLEGFGSIKSLRTTGLGLLQSHVPFFCRSGFGILGYRKVPHPFDFPFQQKEQMVLSD